MDFFENHTHSFIVRVWLEETAEKKGQAAWRGHITHVPTGERRFIKDLDEIAAFIANFYEERMGIKLRKLWCVQRWLQETKAYVSRGPSRGDRDLS